jgi:transposase
MRIAIEAGTHSPWVSRVLEECGHEVLVANARKLRLIYANKRKTDEIDAENLARLARLDPKLLYLLKHRGEDSQAHMAIIRSRQALIGCRTQLVNHVRGAVKSFGARLPKCPAVSFHNKAPEHIPEALLPALGPILETISSLTRRIRDYDRQLETISKERYPETDLLRQVEGIGPLTALTFVLTLEDPYRFEKSRSVGAYLGLVPATAQSGERDPQKASGRQRSLHIRSVWLRLGSKTLWREDSLPWRQELKEAGGCGRGQEACGATTQFMAQRRTLRTTAQHPPLRRSGSLEEEAQPKQRNERKRGGDDPDAAVLKRDARLLYVCPIASDLEIRRLRNCELGPPSSRGARETARKIAAPS